MAAAAAAAAQAEMLEKEKAIVELQQKVQSMKQQVQNMANTQSALTREARRSEITLRELDKLTDDHKVYKSLGRMFVSITVPDMKAEQRGRVEKCTGEVQRLSEEKQKLGQFAEKEEEQLTLQVNDYVAAMKMLQATSATPTK